MTAPHPCPFCRCDDDPHAVNPQAPGYALVIDLDEALWQERMAKARAAGRRGAAVVRAHRAEVDA